MLSFYNKFKYQTRMILGLILYLCIKKKNYSYIVMPFGIGDSIYVSGYIESFIKYHSISKMIVLLKKSHLFFVSSFINNKNVSLISYSNFLISCIAIFFKHTKNKNLYYGHFSDFNIVTKNQENLSISQRYAKYVLAIPHQSNFVFPILNFSKLDLQNILKKYPGLTNRSVLIFPESRSIKSVENDFWVSIINILREKDYSIFINKISKDVNYSIMNKFLIDISIKEIMILAYFNIVTVYFSSRSGICDLLSFLKVNLIIVYLEEKTKKYWSLSDFTKTKEFLLNSNILAYIQNNL
jgi:hypothetical protein